MGAIKIDHLRSKLNLRDVKIQHKQKFNYLVTYYPNIGNLAQNSDTRLSKTKKSIKA